MKLYSVCWWMYSGSLDDYVDYDEDVYTENENHALQLMKIKYPRGKNFKIWKRP